jgi:SP family galactose:H+ symporter-like MFS transporter
MFVSQIVLGLAFLPQFSALRGAMSGGSLMLFVAAWVVGPGTVVFLLISEIYPLHIRGLAMSLVTAVLWGSYLIDTITFLSLIELLGSPGTFCFQAFLGAIAWFLVYFLVPETKGVSLEEIEAHFRAHKPLRALGKRS